MIGTMSSKEDRDGAAHHRLHESFCYRVIYTSSYSTNFPKARRCADRQPPCPSFGPVLAKTHTPLTTKSCITNVTARRDAFAFSMSRAGKNIKSNPLTRQFYTTSTRTPQTSQQQQESWYGIIPPRAQRAHAHPCQHEAPGDVSRPKMSR